MSVGVADLDLDVSAGGGGDFRIRLLPCSICFLGTGVGWGDEAAP